MKNEARFRLISIPIAGILALAGAERAPSRQEVTTLEIPSTIEVEAAEQIDRINSDGFIPYLAGDTDTQSARHEPTR